MTRRRLVVALATVLALLPATLAAQVPQITPPWDGQLPPPSGGIALLTTNRDVDREDLRVRLRDEGCQVLALAVTEGGQWRLFTPGAPSFVNARFPTTLLAGRSFLVRCAPGDVPLILGPQDSGSTIRIEVHDEVSIRLPSNPSAGYAWRVDPTLPPSVISQIGEPEFLPGSDLLGASGVTTVHLLASGPGLVELRLVLDRVFEDSPPLDEWSAVFVVSGQQAVAWLGEIRQQPQAAPTARYLELRVPDLSEGAVPPGVGIRGSDGATTNAIEALVGTGEEVLVWGELTCGVVDYGDCRIDATTILRADGSTALEPTAVTGWAGTVGLVEVDGAPADYFALDGPLPIQYGIVGATEAVSGQLQQAREQGQHIRVWGSLESLVDDVNRARIVVTELALAP